MLGDEPIGMIICGNGGGRSSTFEYFKNLVCFPYLKKHDKQYTKKICRNDRFRKRVIK